MCPFSNSLPGGLVNSTISSSAFPMPFLQSQTGEMLAAESTPLWSANEHSKTPQVAVRPLNGNVERPGDSIPHVDLSYNHNDSEPSLRKLVYRIRPIWRECANELEFTKFTDGITNTLIRIARRRPGAAQEEVDAEAILMRAYGNNTDLIIDRDREARSHALLAERGMAPPLLARFDNGLLYNYVPGKVCTPDDLTRESVWRGVAQKLAEWHARVPVSSVSSKVRPQASRANGHTNGHRNGVNGTCLQNGQISRILENRSPEPNIWSVLQKWVDTLPATGEKERARKELLQHELERTFQELDTQNGIGEQGFVFGHLDLLSANVIMLPTQPEATPTPSDPIPVTFIDYEYATPCPAVFDIANHFAEWAGYDLDYNRLPTRSIRRAFITEYLKSYSQFTSVKFSESLVDSLEEDVNRWRGIPGLWWGIWALIQAQISQIDFDYAQYAEDRLEEYWVWRAETSGTRSTNGEVIPLREQRWAQEA